MFTLTLGDGYPYPFPEGLSEAEQEEINANINPEGIRLRHVESMEWRFMLTVKFATRESCTAAAALTGWAPFDRAGGFILEAKTSRDDGREFPAVIVGDKAYCRLFIESASESAP